MRASHLTENHKSARSSLVCHCSCVPVPVLVMDILVLIILLVVVLVVIVWQAARNGRTKKLPPNMIYLRTYNKYLEQAWPASGGGGYGGIRAVHYEKIAASLRGENVCVMTNSWVTKKEFFLCRAAEGAGSALAIPTRKGRVLPKQPLRGTYRIVARVEEFATIIAKYHNDTTGHPGILKTYGRVSVLCMMMQ